jgi:hypothetical protein
MYLYLYLYLYQVSSFAVSGMTGASSVPVRVLDGAVLLHVQVRVPYERSVEKVNTDKIRNMFTRKCCGCYQANRREEEKTYARGTRRHATASALPS